MHIFPLLFHLPLGRIHHQKSARDLPVISPNADSAVGNCAWAHYLIHPKAVNQTLCLFIKRPTERAQAMCCRFPAGSRWAYIGKRQSRRGRKRTLFRQAMAHASDGKENLKGFCGEPPSPPASGGG